MLRYVIISHGRGGGGGNVSHERHRTHGTTIVVFDAGDHHSIYFLLVENLFTNLLSKFERNLHAQ